MELLKQEKEQLFRTEENLTKDQQVQFLQQTMQGMQQVPAPLLREQGARVLRGGGWRDAGGGKRTAEKLSGAIRKVLMMFCGRRGSGEKPHKEIGCGINKYTLEVGNKGGESSIPNKGIESSTREM